MKWENIDEQVCSVARALAIVGERWTLLIIRDAFKGTRRFEGFHKNLGVTRHRLTERLNSLVESGVMTKVPYSRNPVAWEWYSCFSPNAVGDPHHPFPQEAKANYEAYMAYLRQGQQ
jgi:DNA-binding HxlR family transcriptional regulator